MGPEKKRSLNVKVSCKIKKKNSDRILMFVTFLQKISGTNLNSCITSSDLLVTAWCFALLLWLL